MEAIYECSGCQAGEENYAAKLYERFCDRLEAKSIPFLEHLDEDRYQLELPLPRAYIFGAEDGAAMEGQDLLPQVEDMDDKEELSLPPVEVRQSMSLRQRATMKKQSSAKQIELPPISRGSQRATVK